MSVAAGCPDWAAWREASLRRACVAAGIKPRSLQALRTTFERALAESVAGSHLAGAQ